jgi:hypothetical protein
MLKKPYDRRQIDQRNAAGCRDDAELEVLRGADQSRAIGKQQREQCAEREQHRLQHDAFEARVVDRGNGAEKEALDDRVQRRGHRRPFLLEDGGDREYEAADSAAQQVRHRADRALRREFDLVPGERGGDDAQQEQQAGLVDGSVQGHRRAVAADDSAAGEIEERGFLQGGVAAAHHVECPCGVRLSIPKAGARSVIDTMG